MTSIHAVVPPNLREAVKEAKCRGEDPPKEVQEKNTEVNKSSESQRPTQAESRSRSQITLPQRSLSNRAREDEACGSEDDEVDDATASKENDPSLSPSPVSPLPPSPRKSGLKKRPLSALPTPIDPDDLFDEEGGLGISASDRNIANNNKPSHVDESDGSRNGSGSRKSPKLSEGANGVNASGRIRSDDVDDCAAISPFFSDEMAQQQAQQSSSLTGLGTNKAATTTSYPEGKENMSEKDVSLSKSVERVTSLGAASSPSNSRKTSGANQPSGGSAKNGKPRVGLRRL